MTRATPLASGDLRRNNLSLILGQLARSGPSARSELAEATGLAPATLTSLAAQLVAAGVLAEEADDQTLTRRGRPRVLLRLAGDDVGVAVLQIDADAATGVVASLDGSEIARSRRTHGRPMGDPDAVLDVASAVLAETMAAAGRRIVDLSVVLFAPVGGDPAVVLADTDLGWGTVDVVAGLRRRGELPAEPRLVRDGIVAARAEQRALGAGDLVYLKSDSGIGGAVIAGGRALLGTHGTAGEFGHVPVVPRGESCACGQRGCLVTVAGPDALLAAAGLEALATSEGLAPALAEFGSRLDAGEPRATAAWQAGLEWLSIALRQATIVLGPEVIVLGGHLRLRVAEIARAVAEGLPAPLAVPRIVAGALGADAALVGAIWEARERVLADPVALINFGS